MSDTPLIVPVDEWRRARAMRRRANKADPDVVQLDAPGGRPVHQLDFVDMIDGLKREQEGGADR